MKHDLWTRWTFGYLPGERPRWIRWALFVRYYVIEGRRALAAWIAPS
jgi:hypothetical protein